MEHKDYQASELAELTGGVLKGNPGATVNGVNSLKLAAPSDASFLHSTKYNQLLKTTRAGILLIPNSVEFEPAEGNAAIVCQDPDKAFTQVCALFAPPEIAFEPGIQPGAFVHPGVKLGANVHVGPTAVIEEGAEIGDNSVICAGAYIGHGVLIGKDAKIFPNVSIMRYCELGNRVIIHAGTTIGADGFGYTPTFRGLVKIPQNGIVRIEDDVEIGANCTIDRARFGKTWIKKGVKIDNLVHVAHNVIVGESTVLIGQSGIAGSAELGRGVVIGAQAGVNGHITLEDGAKVAGASAVQKGVPMGQTVFGTPAENQSDFFERHTLPRRVKKLLDRVAALEAKLAENNPKS